MAVATQQDPNRVDVEALVETFRCEPFPQAPAGYDLDLLTSCLTIDFVHDASARGITVRSVAFEMERAIETVELRMQVDTDATGEALAEVWTHLQRTSPLLDPRRNSAAVTVGLAA